MKQDALLSQTLEKQIDTFIDQLEAYNKKRPSPRRKESYIYLRHLFKQFVKDRNQRAFEIESPEYQKILAFAQKQLPVKTMFNLCIDGRVTAIFAFGMSAIVGSSLRVPGGMIRDFIRGTDAKLKLRKDSNYARLMLHAFEKYGVDTVVEVYDSHVGCAARGAEEQGKGRKPADQGLFADVSHKRQISEAVVRFMKQYKDKNVIPVQTSFDPHSGYLYMGLEIETAFDYAKSHGGFTKDVLDDLVEKKQIISTEKLAQNKEIKEILADYFFPVDWLENYTESAKAFWETVPKVKKTLTPILEPLLLTIFPQLALQEKEERLFLLTTNVLSAYLHNHTQTQQKNGKLEEHMHQSHYPYGVHKEEIVSVSEGGYPPNRIASFVVFSLDGHNVPEGVALSASLVRQNRMADRITDSQELFEDKQQFVEAAVPIVVPEIVRDYIDGEWQKLEMIDWSDMPQNWDTMSDTDFFAYLKTKGRMPQSVISAINTLRNHMIVLYDPSSAVSGALVDHYIVALPLIVGRFRKNHFVVPFVKLGFA